MDYQDKYKELILTGRWCDYCDCSTELVNSAEIYNGQDFGKMWICRQCRAYVGCHYGSSKALGRVANPQLRNAKKIAHHYFDQIWAYYQKVHKTSKREARKAGYRWLSANMKTPISETHIGMFDINQCLKATKLSKEYLKKKVLLKTNF